MEQVKSYNSGMNIAMWGKALRVIPKVSKSEWRKLDPIAKWLIATRSAVFLMTIFSAIIGGSLAFSAGRFEILRFLICLIGLVLAHATNNLLNDFTDSVRGVDKGNYFRNMYGPQPIEHGLWSKRKMLVIIAGNGMAAAICGIALILLSGISVLWLMLAGAFFVLFYTWPLKLIGLGEIAVLIVWGPLMVGGTYLSISGSWSWNAALLGIIYAIGPTTVLLGKHTDKLKEDKEKQIHTLPVLIGESAARLLVLVLIFIELLSIIMLFIFGIIGWPILIILFSIPSIIKVAKVFKLPRPSEKPVNFPDEGWPTYLAAHAFYCNQVIGGLFILGLLLTIAFSYINIF